jgi:hypothetical protein
VRIAFELQEVAAVLQVPLSEVREMLRRGELDDVGLGMPRINIDQLLEAVVRQVDDQRLSPFALFVLGELIAGRLAVPRPARNVTTPPPLTDLLRHDRSRPR